MHKHLLTNLLFAVMVFSCVSTTRRTGTETANRNNINTPVSSGFEDVDTTFIMQPDLPAGKTAVSLMEQPRTEDGAFVLIPGLYEADFKTYCLQPGTPGPSANDAYFQAPLKGARKEIIQTILTNSRTASHLEQKNVQLLLWSVVSRSDFNKLSPPVQSTARQLLSPKQVFELQGGVMGVVKTVARTLPSPGGQHSIRQLFDMGISSYDAYERLAVVNTPSVMRRPDFKRDQWYKHREGYYVRYFPESYKQTRIQVYVPENVMDSAAHDTEDYVVFDPASWVVVPAYSNAQRLGIGGPVLDIVRSVIHTIGKPKPAPPPKESSKGKVPESNQ